MKYLYINLKILVGYIINFVRVKKLETLYIIQLLSILNNVTLTIFSKYKTIKRNHLLNQNRSVLTSKILKQIHNLDFIDKITKYKFLSIKYDMLSF